MAHNASSSSARRRKTSNGYIAHREGSQGPEKKSQTTVVIDYEIPRKVLHSSIGIVALYLYYNRYSAIPVAGVLGGALGVIGTVDAIRLARPHGAFNRLYRRILGFLMRKEEQFKVNGVVWYLCGVTLSLLSFPRDVAVVSILLLSWADTAASTFGRLIHSRRLPSEVPILHIPLAPRKSCAGSIAATATAALIAATFWGFAPHPYPRNELSWTWTDGVRAQPGPLITLLAEGAPNITQKFLRGSIGGILPGPSWAAGWPGLFGLAVITGLIGGGVEALDLGSLDDNLTLPILAGSAIWAVMTFLAKAPSWFK